VTSTATHIAVVDDEASVRTMLGRVLRVADYEVAAYDSGEAFLESLATRIPACAIVDVNLPGLSGLDVRSRMRAAHCDVPCIFITASDDPALDTVVRGACGVALLRKPFTSEELLAALDRALRAR
jgi:FixJ family two-component response regulator